MDWLLHCCIERAFNLVRNVYIKYPTQGKIINLQNTQQLKIWQSLNWKGGFKSKATTTQSYCASLISSGFNAFWSFISNPMGSRICILDLTSFLAACQSSPKRINFHATYSENTLFSKTAKLSYWSQDIEIQWQLHWFLHFSLNLSSWEPCYRIWKTKCKLFKRSTEFKTITTHLPLKCRKSHCYLLLQWESEGLQV